MFLVCVCLYALSLGRGFYSSDGEVMFLTTAALVENGGFALDPDSALPQIVAGEGGRTYSKYDPGLSLAMVPFYVAGDWLAAINAAHRYRVAALAVLFVPVLAAAGAVAGVTRLALRLTGQRFALWIALAAGIASPLWWYARVLFAEAVLAWALVAVVALVWGAGNAPLSRRVPARRMVIAGLVFGAGIAVRAAFAVYFPALVWLAWRGGREYTQRERVWQMVVYGGAFGIGMLPGIALVLGHNVLRFGDPGVFGYGGEGFTAPAWKGALGLLISPGKGALITTPPLLLSALLWPRWRRSAPALAEFLALAWGSALVFYGSWWAWDGGWCWGPRFVVPLIPLSMLPLAVLGRLGPQRGAKLERFLVVALGLLVIAGIAVNGAAVLVDVVPHYAAVAGTSAADVDRINWTLRDGLPAAAWDRLLRGATEPLALFHLGDSGLPVTWTAGLPALACAGLAVGLWRCVRVYRRSTR